MSTGVIRWNAKREERGAAKAISAERGEPLLVWLDEADLNVGEREQLGNLFKG